ncbi:MAG: ATP-binding protein [Paludibacter sp.]
MSLIRKPYELSVPQNIKVLFYGQPGMGKTTLALSAPKPLLLDFDNGIHRVNYGHQSDAVQISNWKEALDVLAEDLSAYETIVVDTIGKMLDYIITYVCPSGNPRIQDWGKINQEFSNFTRTASALNKNIIYVAHRDIRKEGDDNVFVPALREKSYSAIVTELDLLGYVEAKGTTRTITFTPTSRNDGKNTCNLPGLMNIPTVVDAQGKALTNIFFQNQIIAPYVANLSQRLETAKAYEIIMGELKEQIMLITDDLSANDFVGRIDKFEHVANSRAIAANLAHNKAISLGLKFNKEIKGYEKVQLQNSLV